MNEAGWRAAPADRTLAHLVSSAFQVPLADLNTPTRGGRRTALARQTAIYLAHVALGLDLACAGRLFGRDRTTAAYACRRIEERREELCFDAGIDHLDRALRARFAACPGELPR